MVVWSHVFNIRVSWLQETPLPLQECDLSDSICTYYNQTSLDVDPLWLYPQIQTIWEGSWKETFSPTSKAPAFLQCAAIRRTQTTFFYYMNYNHVNGLQIWTKTDDPPLINFRPQKATCWGQFSVLLSHRWCEAIITAWNFISPRSCGVFCFFFFPLSSAMQAEVFV